EDRHDDVPHVSPRARADVPPAAPPAVPPTASPTASPRVARARRGGPAAVRSAAHGTPPVPLRNGACTARRLIRRPTPRGGNAGRRPGRRPRSPTTAADTCPASGGPAPNPSPTSTPCCAGRAGAPR